MLCFLIPASITAFLYLMITIKLCRQTRHASRNMVLTVAFAVSWLAWVVCWLPNYSILGFQLLDKMRVKREPKDYTYLTGDYDYIIYFEYVSHYDYLKRKQSSFEFNFAPWYTYVQAFRIPIQLFYSHINPFLYLLVLKKFQQHHYFVFRFFWRKLLSKKMMWCFFVQIFDLFFLFRSDYGNLQTCISIMFFRRINYVSAVIESCQRKCMK